MLYKRNLSIGDDGLSLTVDSAIYQLCGFGQITSSLRSCSLIYKQMTLILVMYFLVFLGASDEIMAMHGADDIMCSLSSFHFPHEHTTRLTFLVSWLYLVGPSGYVLACGRWCMLVTSLQTPHHHHHYWLFLSFLSSRCNFSEQSWEPCVLHGQLWTWMTA